ncbi:beta-ketoacyl synthase N-terminal-like domain-containing protein [Streptomyces sp. AA0539]|uniref:beta-ketoacyl synthase N-terminal-like domain-containing protein n=1 Tax=Streptomyces sp. AA0539 TaxID=1210045 RepID=UPI00036FA311|nr:beta-ketoacyl synthase N-terminal-like domain-containing protein [Streptomyces sp. AA0539]
MNALVVTGTGRVSPKGGAPATPPGQLPRPADLAFPAEGFDPAGAFDLRTTRSQHRSTLLALAASAAALADAGLDLADSDRDGIGVALGTHVGSLTGAVTHGRESFRRERPFLVNPSTFPNLILNTSAGAVAIAQGLRGANTTVAGGPVAAINALRHAEVALRAGHVDTMLVGAAEEYGEHEAWLAAVLRPGRVLGEAAAFMVLEREEAASGAGRPPLAKVSATVTRQVDPTAPGDIGTLLTSALERSGTSREQVRRVAVRLAGDPRSDAALRRAVAVTTRVEPLDTEPATGDCHAAHAAVQLVETAVACRDEKWGPEEAGAVVAVDGDGLAGVAVLTGFGAW